MDATASQEYAQDEHFKLRFLCFSRRSHQDPFDHSAFEWHRSVPQLPRDFQSRAGGCELHFGGGVHVGGGARPVVLKQLKQLDKWMETRL